MGTITERRLRDGAVSYTARIRIRRGGKLVVSEAETFDSRPEAEAWLARTEKRLKRPGALSRLMAQAPQMTVGQGDRTVSAGEAVRIGRTKSQVLQASLAHAHDIAAVELPQLRSSHLVAFAQALADGGRSPSTVGNYLSHLSPVLRVARVAWVIDVDPQVMKDAAGAASHLGLIGRSRRRERRPTLDELTG